MNQRVAPAPDCVDLNTIFRPITNYNLLRPWRIEEAFKCLNGQVRLQGLAIHGTKSFDFALFRRTCDTFRIGISNAVLASIAEPNKLIDFVPLEVGAALALIVLSSQYYLPLLSCPLMSSRATRLQSYTFGHL